MTRPMVVEAEPAFRTEHANPYNARLYRAVMATGVIVRDLSYGRLLTSHVDIVHLHWPDLTFLSGTRRWLVVARLMLFYGFLRVARLRGTRVMWTVHNLSAHESRSTPALRAWYNRSLMANVDGIIALTETGVSAARVANPMLASVPAYVTAHGHYRLDYDFSMDRNDARAALGLKQDGTIVLSVGQIRPYKNIPHLIRTFLAGDTSGATLVIAGRPLNTALQAEIEQAAAGNSRVLIDPTFQSNERIALWLRACDLVVLPYSAIQNSGSAMLALSADRPVLVPDIGAMAELEAGAGAQWVRRFAGELDNSALSAAIEWAQASDRPDVADLAAFDWTTIAHFTINAYVDLLARPRVTVRRRKRAASTTRSYPRTAPVRTSVNRLPETE